MKITCANGHEIFLRKRIVLVVFTDAGISRLLLNGVIIGCHIGVCKENGHLHFRVDDPKYEFLEHANKGRIEDFGWTGLFVMDMETGKVIDDGYGLVPLPGWCLDPMLRAIKLEQFKKKELTKQKSFAK